MALENIHATKLDLSTTEYKENMFNLPNKLYYFVTTNGKLQIKFEQGDLWEIEINHLDVLDKKGSKISMNLDKFKSLFVNRNKIESFNFNVNNKRCIKLYLKDILTKRNYSTFICSESNDWVTVFKEKKINIYDILYRNNHSSKESSDTSRNSFKSGQKWGKDETYVIDEFNITISENGVHINSKKNKDLVI